MREGITFPLLRAAQIRQGRPITADAIDMSPIESLRLQIENFWRQQLAAYIAQLPGQRSGTGQPIGTVTIEHRARGATDFVDFLLGHKRTTERIRR